MLNRLILAHWGFNRANLARQVTFDVLRRSFNDTQPNIDSILNYSSCFNRLIPTHWGLNHANLACHETFDVQAIRSQTGLRLFWLKNSIILSNSTSSHLPIGNLVFVTALSTQLFLVFTSFSLLPDYRLEWKLEWKQVPFNTLSLPPLVGYDRKRKRFRYQDARIKFLKWWLHITSETRLIPFIIIPISITASVNYKTWTLPSNGNIRIMSKFLVGWI